MLSQHSLNKGRSKRLVSAVAALSLFFGAAHVAPTASAQEIGAKFSIDEDEHGYRIASGSTNHQIRTELFSATAQAGGEKRLAYCTEWEVNFQKTNDAYAAKWSDFPGKNKFKDDETVRQKINWIAANSYPAVSYETVLQKAGVTASQVSKKSVIAQTQAAIWNLGSGFDYKGLAQGEGTAEEQQNAKKVYEYLLGPANVGRAESTSVDLQVGFKGKDTATRQANGTFGPFTLDTNADSVEVTAETGQVVDKNGNAFPANEIKNGQEFYFKAEEQAGSAKLIAKAASSEVNGALIISKKEGGGHHQTLIVTHDKEKTKEAELYIEWKGTNARLSTTARKKGDEHSQRVKSKGGTIVDIVAYEGLIVGKEYTLKGQLYERRVKEGTDTVEAVPTDIKSEKKFTPTQEKDEVHLELEIPEGYAGKTLVVFEEAYGPDGKLIAKHADINDENQTIYVNQPYQDMSSDSSAAKTGSAGAMFAGSSKCFSGGAAGGSSKKEDKNKGSLGDLFAGSSSLFGGDKDKDKGGSDSNGGSTNGGNGNGNGGSNTQNGSTGDNKDNNGSTSGSTGGGNGNGGGNGGANGGSDTKTGSDAGAVAGSAGGALTGSSSDKDKDKKGSTAGSSGDNKGNGNGQGAGGSDGKSGSDANSTSDTNGGSTAGSSGEGKGKGQGNGTGQGDGNGGSTAGSSGEGKGKGQGNGGANGGSDTQNGSDSENKSGSAALAGSTGGADCGGALALGALAVGGLVLTAVGFNVLAKNAAPAPLAGAADPKSDTKGAAPAAGDPNNKNATNSNTKGAEPKEKGVAHKDPNTSKMDVKSASPAKSNSALANTGVSGILIMLAIAAVAAIAGGALIFFGRRKKN
jgi:LPXTG-motif cell wall anchor domain protein